MPSSRGRKVLVLGHDTRAFLSVVRSLGRAGIEVHVAWFEEGGPALRSRYVAQRHRIPAYDPQTTAWKDGLAALMRTERFDLVVPCDDQRGLPLAAHRAELERFGRLAVPASDALEVLGDKHSTTKLARSLGVPVPREAIVSQAGEVAPVRDKISPPLILKPATSYTINDVERRGLVRRADSWKAAELVLGEMLIRGPVAVQEFYRGEGVGVELLMSEGTPLLAFEHLRLHEPMHGGGSSYRRGVPVSPDLLGAAVKVLEALGYTGVAMVEFKRDAGTGRWVLLEVNARFWGSLPLALASGADFPLALFELLVDGGAESTHPGQIGLCARNLRADAGWHLANLRADRSDPTLTSRPWPGVALETGVSLIAGRERIDTFTLDDPAPGFAELGRLTRALARRSGRLASGAHWPVSRRRRRRLQAEARTELRRAARVLFVCKGNIGRSPFAAAIAGGLLGEGHELSSAGLLEAGRRSPSEAVAAAAAWDVDLSAHRSRTVSAELVTQSDTIFVFDQQNLNAMTERFPQAVGRLHLLGALNARGRLLVPDPWGHGPEVYAAVYQQIAKALSAAISP